METLTDWKALAKARGLEMEGGELESVLAPLRTLEGQFRPLAARLDPAQYPATVFHADPERGH